MTLDHKMKKLLPSHFYFDLVPLAFNSSPPLQNPADNEQGTQAARSSRKDGRFVLYFSVNLLRTLSDAAFPLL